MPANWLKSLNMTRGRKKIVVIGSTGSIGKQTLEVVRANPEDFRVVGLTAYLNKELLKKQVEEFNPKYGGTTFANEIIKMVAASDVDIVVVACRSTDLLPVVINAIEAGKTIAMANKEMIVEEGATIMNAVKEHNTTLIPVDSEHSGIFQCMQGRKKENIEKVILTCSGGPFRETDPKDLEKVTVKEALNHPTWKMGRKITVDSATLMNKALEIIEAKYLFDLEPEQIEVLIHPQSIVHALVQFKDGNTIAHFGYPDMKIPISYALYYPEVKENNLKRIDFTSKTLEFYKPNKLNFPSIGFAYDALSRKSGCAKRLNQSNEEAVKKFLKGEIIFPDIFRHIKENTFKEG